MIGRDGNDTLVGDSGNDILLGGRGSDIVDGGAGRDRAAYWNADGAVRADLLDSSINTGEAQGDVFTDIEDLQGGDFDDDLRGDNADNRLWGGDGQDRINGRGGIDSLYGGDGDDILLGGSGPDVIDGGAGRDRAAYWTAPDKILADLLYPDLGTGDAAGDSFINVEDLQGTNFNDNLRGTDAANSIWGVDGADLIYGRGGDDALYGQDGEDVLLGGTGADTLDGGAGNDRAAYWRASSDVRVDLFSPNNSTGEAAGDVFISIEDLQGTNFNDDLRGDNDENRLWGGKGNDTLHGRGGSDAIYGQDGDDILLPGAGADIVDGGAGTDRVAYWTSGNGIVASLANPALNTGDAAGDSFVSIEDLQGTNHNDLLTGDAGANRLFGGKGNDTLDGGAGNDTLNGGNGMDNFIFGAGDDWIEGFEGGTDLLVFDLAAADSLGAQGILDLAAASNGGTLFSFGNDSLFLDGVAPDGLSLNDISVI
ncbi:MAG: calcium-binding protein [Pseudomonadota bacterium]